MPVFRRRSISRRFCPKILNLIAKLPRMVCLKAVFGVFPAKFGRKIAVSRRSEAENAKNSIQESGNRIRLPILTGFRHFLVEPDRSGHRIRYQYIASMKSLE